MADIIKLAEIDIDLDKAVKNIQNLKEALSAADEASKKAKKESGETSAAYIRANAAYKATAQELRTQESLFVKVTGALKNNAGYLQEVEAASAQLREQRKKLKIEDENYDAELKKINDSLDANTKFIKENSDAQKKQTLNVGNYEEAVKPVKVQLREITLLMQQMAAAGNDNSVEFIELAQRAGKLKDAMNATNDQIKVFATGDKFEATLKMAKGSFDALSGAAQTYEGTMAALGIKNEAAEESIKTMVAAQTIQNGVTQIHEALQKESAFMLTVNTVKTNIMSASQAIYTAAIGTSTGALKAFKIALLGTGIGAVIVAIGLLIANWDKLSGAINSSAKAQEKYNDEVKKIELSGSIINKQIDERISRLKKQGATDEEIAKVELARQLALIKNAEAKKKLDEDEFNRLKELDKNGQSKWNKQLAAEIYLQKVKVDNSEKNIAVMKESYNIDIANLTQYYKDKREKDNKEADEKAKNDRENQSKRNKDYIDAENKKFGEEVALIMERYKQELDERKNAADEAIRIANAELELWKLHNKERISKAGELTTELIIEEENRLLIEEEKTKESLERRFANGELLYKEYQLGIEQAEDATNTKRIELQNMFQQQEAEKRKQALVVNYENEYALAEGNLFAQLDLQRQANEQKRLEEVGTAKRIGADVKKVNDKFNKADIELEKAKTNAKLSLAAGFAGNLSAIFGEQSKVGKAAAVAQTTISTYQAATGAYAALAPIPIVGPVLGIAAAGAAVAAGLANVKKILAVKTDSTSAPSSDGVGSATSTAATSSMLSANSNIGAGIVSRDTTATLPQQQTQPTSILVADEVTAKQIGTQNKTQMANI